MIPVLKDLQQACKIASESSPVPTDELAKLSNIQFDLFLPENVQEWRKAYESFLIATNNRALIRKVAPAKDVKADEKIGPSKTMILNRSKTWVSILENKESNTMKYVIVGSIVLAGIGAAAYLIMRKQ